MSSHRFLLRRVWHLAIPTPPAMSSHRFHRFAQNFLLSVFSHGFLLRRVWHLAIPTPFAMGYSPTEYAEFTEPPTEMSSHGFHRFTQILRVRCSPTEFTEYTEFGSVGMAGMPYPPTSVRIRVICGRLFSARSFCAFRAFCGNIFSPTEFTESTEFGSVGMAGMPYPPTSVNICVICGSLFSARGSVYSVHSVGASSPLVRLVLQRLLHPLAESTEVVRTSHHLTISPQQHHFTSNPAFCMSSQYCGYDFVTTCGSLMRSPGNTIAAGANAIAMRWSS